MSELKLIHDSDGDWRGPKNVLLCGIRIPAYATFDPDFEKDLPQFCTRQDDVFVVSYPKSGTVTHSSQAVHPFPAGAVLYQLQPAP